MNHKVRIRPVSVVDENLLPLGEGLQRLAFHPLQFLVVAGSDLAIHVVCHIPQGNQHRPGFGALVRCIAISRRQRRRRRRRLVPLLMFLSSQVDRHAVLARHHRRCSPTAGSRNGFGKQREREKKM